MACAGTAVLQVTARVDQPLQTIRGFGACDAWTPELLERKWRDNDLERLTTLLFSTERDSGGRPRGAGLSSWRTLLGAGSEHTGCVADPWRRTQCYLNHDFYRAWHADARVYDFTRCSGQRRFITAAVRHGVGHFVVHAHSPPACLTANGKTHANPAPDGGIPRCNLNGQFDAFANYVAACVLFLERSGARVAAVSPCNEPHRRWDTDDQEGCSYTNTDLAHLAAAVARALRRRDCAAAVALPESGTADFLCRAIPGREAHSGFLEQYEQEQPLSPPDPGWSPVRSPSLSPTQSPGSRSPPLPAAREGAAHVITAHSYWSCWPQEDRLVGCREQVRTALDRAGSPEYWVTEYAARISGEGWVPSGAARELLGSRDAQSAAADMGHALWAARVLHMDLVVAGAAYWSWFLALSPYGEPEGLLHADPDLSGRYRATKCLWALAHWSYFVRPGWSMLAVERSDSAAARDTTHGVMVTAFASPQGWQVALVFINYGSADRDVRVEVGGAWGLLRGGTTFSAWVTSDTASVQPCGAVRLGGQLPLPARSLTTLSGALVAHCSQFHISPLGRSGLCLAPSGPPLSRSEYCHIVGLVPRAGAGAAIGPALMLQTWQFRKIEPEGCADNHCHIAVCDSGLLLEELSFAEQKQASAPVHLAHAALGGFRDVQAWQLEASQDGGGLLIRSGTGRVLDWSRGSVVSAPRTGARTQLWQLLPPGSGPLPSAAPPPSPRAGDQQVAACGESPWDAPSPAAPSPKAPDRPPLRRYDGAAVAASIHSTPPRSSAVCSRPSGGKSKSLSRSRGRLEWDPSHSSERTPGLSPDPVPPDPLPPLEFAAVADARETPPLPSPSPPAAEPPAAAAVMELEATLALKKGDVGQLKGAFLRSLEAAAQAPPGTLAMRVTGTSGEESTLVAISVRDASGERGEHVLRRAASALLARGNCFDSDRSSNSSAGRRPTPDESSPAEKVRDKWKRKTW